MIAYGLKPAQQFTGIAALREMWTVADEGGFDGCWVFDHFAALGPDPAGDVFEAWALLAAMAHATRGGQPPASHLTTHPTHPAGTPTIGLPRATPAGALPCEGGGVPRAPTHAQP